MSNPIENRLQFTTNLLSQSEFIPITNNTQMDQCNSCRRLESTDRMKLVQHASQLNALKKEERKLKSLHRKLEMRIKQFLYRTRKSIQTEEKLLTLEKHSHKELLQRQKTLFPTKSFKQSKNLWDSIRQMTDENEKLNKSISSLCTQIKQMEKNTKVSLTNQTEPHKKIKSMIHTEDQLYRMNVQLNEICTENTELRQNVEHMLNKRREMIDEYHRLRQTMHNATNESRQLTVQCSESFVNRRNLVGQMRAIRDEQIRDEKKLLDDLRELSRLLENDKASKHFLRTKSHTREKQCQLNELFAGKGSEGIKHAYTAEEFRRLFHVYFDQDFPKEKILHQTVERFLNEHEQSFTLFEYTVELINELNHLHQNLENKRERIRKYFSEENINSFTIKDLFAQLEYSVHEADVNVQSLEIAKTNLRQLLNNAYQIISNLFSNLDCDRNQLFSIHQTIDDRNILLYLATIESRLQQLFPSQQKKSKSNEHYNYIDDTTISWKMDDHTSQLPQSFFIGNDQLVMNSLQGVTSITPSIPSIEEIAEIDDDDDHQIIPEEIVHSILNVYNECVFRSKNENKIITKENDDIQ